MFCQLDEHYFEHPKIQGLKKDIGDTADVYPIRLWAFCLRYAKTGILKSPEYIELACGWTGEKGKLLQALQKYCFVEDDGCTVHDWQDHTGGGIERYENRKQEAKAARALYREAKRAEYRKVVEELPEGYRRALNGEAKEDRKTGVLEGNDASRGDASGAPEPFVLPDRELPGTNASLLFKLASRVVAGNPGTVRGYLEKWIAQKGAAEVEKILMDPATKGQSVMAIQKFYFDTLGSKQTGGYLG